MTVVATGRLVHESLKAADEAESGGHLRRGPRPAHAPAARRGGDRRVGEEDEPLRRRARGRHADGLRRRGGGLSSRSRRSTGSTLPSSVSARSSRRFRSPRPWSSTSSRTPRTCCTRSAARSARWLARSSCPGSARAWSRARRQVAQGRGRRRREGRAALRARHRQGDAGGRGRGLRCPPEDRRPGGRGACRHDARVHRRGGRGGGGGNQKRRLLRSRSLSRRPRNAHPVAAAPPAERADPASASRPRRSRGGSRVSRASISRPVKGTGPDGRIVAEDVERLAAASVGISRRAGCRAAPVAAAAPAMATSDRVEEPSSIRKTIARRRPRRPGPSRSSSSEISPHTTGNRACCSFAQEGARSGRAPDR